MKKVANYFEGIIENVHESDNWKTTFITLLLVVVLGAGSLMMLLNTQA